MAYNKSQAEDKLYHCLLDMHDVMKNVNSIMEECERAAGQTSEILISAIWSKTDKQIAAKACVDIVAWANDIESRLRAVMKT